MHQMDTVTGMKTGWTILKSSKSQMTSELETSHLLGESILTLTVCQTAGKPTQDYIQGTVRMETLIPTWMAGMQMETVALFLQI